MISNDKIIKVINRNNGTTGYTIPDLGNLHRNFQPGEEKELPFEELKKLSYLPGGMYILQNLLVIEDAEAVKELLRKVEPEYNYTEKDIKKLMTTGTLEAFLDMLDFAPTGVLEMVKSLAVSLPLNDVAKREAIKEKLGLDVDSAIKLRKEAETPVETTNKRRVAIPKTQSDVKSTGRRVIIEKKK